MTAPLSEAYLAEVEAREAAASPGPWLQGVDGYSVSGPDGGDFSDLQISIDVGDTADAAFIAVARDAVPTLLAEVRRLREAEAGRATVRPGSRRDLLLLTIRAEGGEWTVGRVKALYAESDTGHVYRATVRADLGALHRAGHLVLHDTNGRRFYTVASRGAL